MYIMNFLPDLAQEVEYMENHLSKYEIELICLGKG